MTRNAFLTVSVLLFVAPIVAQDSQLPPISWTCPMHPEILETENGSCSICRMDLSPVRLTTNWSCPVHAIVNESAAGKCPICGRALVEVVSALSWTCSDDPDIDAIDPGKCSDGSSMIERHTLRAHSNHNPQHGGLFFMAADNWHHIEGTYPQKGLFRLHLYDDYSRSLPADKLKVAGGRVVTKEAVDADTGKAVEITAFPLRPGTDGRSLEARIDSVAPPLELIAKVRIEPAGPEYRFDFVFNSLSLDSMTAMAASPGEAPIAIPDNASDIVAMLQDRATQVRSLIQSGAFREVFVPAFQAKDLALVLDLRAGELPPEQRPNAAASIGRLVRSAWQLDLYGDMGNRDLIQEAYAAFVSSIEEVATVFSPRRK